MTTTDTITVIVSAKVKEDGTVSKVIETIKVVKVDK